jgi:uncharacterized repeat protein (TIGR03803 family)
MTRTMQHRISRMCRRAASAALALAVVFVAAIAATQLAQAQTFTILYTFTGSPDGQLPFAALIGDAAGNLFGTTAGGGAAGAGTVFTLDKTGKETVLYSFTPGSDGGGPTGPVLRDAKGNLYGTAQCCGSGNYGTVFKLDTTGKETVLYSFTGQSDGAGPSGKLVRDAAGNLYGTTSLGGASFSGTVFKVDKTGKETVLHSFTAGADGYFPFSGLIRDGAGNLYGTTNLGGGSGCGGNGCGTVFKLTPGKNGRWKEKVLYSFAGGADGAGPAAGVIRDAVGNLYSTTVGGGASGVGTVFKLSKTGKETVLYSFAGGTDGAVPYEAGLVRDAKGGLYGTTYFGGGSGCGGSGCGTVFKISSTRKETVLYSFTGGADGAFPLVGLLRNKAGDLYGTASSGGDSSCTGGCGTVFEITP